MKPGADELALEERFYAMQVKQKDKTGRADIDAFETAMRRANAKKDFLSASIIPATRCARLTASSVKNIKSSSAHRPRNFRRGNCKEVSVKTV